MTAPVFRRGRSALRDRDLGRFAAVIGRGLDSATAAELTRHLLDEEIFVLDADGWLIVAAVALAAARRLDPGVG